MEALFMVGGMGLLIVGIIAFSRYMSKKRTAALQELAGRLGMDFYAEDEGKRLSATMRGIKQFGRGHGHNARNLMVSRLGSAQQVIFDYQYRTGSGKNKSTHQHTLLLLEYPDAALPSFSLSREFGFFRKVSNFFGMDDIDFDSHPQFSDQYLLKGENEQWVREAFTEDIRDYFTRKPGLTVAGQGRYLAFFQKAGHLKPEDHLYRELMETGSELAELFFKKA